MIVRSFVWFIPSKPPTKAFIIATNVVIFEIGIITAVRNIIGASFCTEDSKKQFIHEIEDITDGYHMWNGASPILIIRLNISIVNILMFVAVHRNILVISRILDPKAWIRKYFTIASVSWNFDEDIIIGMKHSRFNSIVIHINIQFGLSMAIVTLAISEVYISK